MAYKNREVQPELFSTIKKKQKCSFLNKNIFKHHYRTSLNISCDTLIVIIISLIMINLSCFAIGIEKGKAQIKSAEKEKLKNRELKVLARQEIKKEPKKPVNKKINKPDQTAKIKEEPKEKIDQEKIKPKKGYIIQLVTYSSNDYANKEAQRLRDEGYQSYVLKSGEYFVVYSGMYDNKVSATKILPALKKRYKDCFVRFLKNT